MSGGKFEYFQNRYEWDDAIDCIQNIINTNECEYNPETINEFKKSLEIIKKARIYIKRVDWLLSGDDNEESFHESLAEDLLQKG